jgi:hypothetical protein
MLPGSASQLQAQLVRQAEQQLQRQAYGALKQQQQQRPRTPPPPLHGRLLCRELPDGRRVWGRLHFVGTSDAHRPYVAVFEDGSQHSHDDASVEPHLQPQDARLPPGVTLPTPFSAASTWQPALNRNVIGVKHASAADIRSVVWWLSQSQCRSTRNRIPAKHIMSKQPSIQGAWSATTF